MVYVLDTHPVIWFLEKSPRLSTNAKSVLNDANAELVLPTIALLEIQSLYAKNRIQVSPEDVRHDLISLTNCLIYPLDEQVVSLCPDSLNIHDSIIVGTALVYRDIYKQSISLITKNGEITKSGIIQTLW
jgi:PIN domain nuclease of toxin-antitoxin system